MFAEEKKLLLPPEIKSRYERLKFNKINYNSEAFSSLTLFNLTTNVMICKISNVDITYVILKY
jgi:hypothetical protein